MGYCRRNHRKGSFTLMDGSVVDADQRNAPISVDTYYITPNKCTDARVFMKSRSVLLFARSTAVFPMKCIGKQWKSCWRKRKKCIFSCACSVEK